MIEFAFKIRRGLTFLKVSSRKCTFECFHSRMRVRLSGHRDVPKKNQISLQTADAGKESAETLDDLYSSN